MEPVFSQRLEDGRVLCSLCPRRCRLGETDTGWCGALERREGELVLTSSGPPFRLDVGPVEASGLRRFCPGTAFAAIVTRGSGLEVRTEPRIPEEESAPWLDAAEAVGLARAWGCRGIYLKADDPVFGITEGFTLFEKAGAAGLKTALRTSGYMLARGREILFAHADAVEFRLFSVTGAVYGKRFGARVEPVLDTIAWAHGRPGLWTEITVPILPGENDTPEELARLGDWILARLGPGVPVQVSSGVPFTYAESLESAVAALRGAGLRDVEPVVARVADPLSRIVQ